jgi:hypothetical protein
VNHAKLEQGENKQVASAMGQYGSWNEQGETEQPRHGGRERDWRSANLAEDDGVLVGPLLALLREEGGGHRPHPRATAVRSPSPAAALPVHDHVHHVLVRVLLLLLHALGRRADPHSKATESRRPATGWLAGCLNSTNRLPFAFLAGEQS